MEFDDFIVGPQCDDFIPSQADWDDFHAWRDDIDNPE